jgi:glycosyltransferase involved in cell wall biosynthesis
MYTKDKRILILVPSSNARGGITEYYKTLKKYFSLPVDYFERGSRNWPLHDGFFSISLRIIKDTYSFYKKLKTEKYVLVQTSTSFSSFSIIRDAMFVLIARWFSLKIIVFFHGWNLDYVNRIEKKSLKTFKSIYFKTDAIIDLSEMNLKKLVEWGYTNPLFLETTVVDEELTQNLSISTLEEKYSENNEKIILLFLARIEKAKGIYEAIDTFSILKKKFPSLQMIIAGDGKEEILVKEYVKKKNLLNIIFTGFVDGACKRELFIQSKIYILPSYSEGMPTTVLEAMAFGLPVITRPVGGIPDFFKNGKNGFYDESKDPFVFAGLIEKLLLDRPLMKKIAITNFAYAKDRFLSNRVVERVEKIFISVINS